MACEPHADDTLWLASLLLLAYGVVRATGFQPMRHPNKATKKCEPRQTRLDSMVSPSLRDPAVSHTGELEAVCPQSIDQRL
ncbi:hypothetical protein GGR52DRAFT_197507 [Hypoxylon sp. FL1284]|nr:hypothetical protein GGR52DRAFT_197507 [Hypoxylon sp. FL1284]